MKYLQKSFTSGAASQAYRDNFDRIFRRCPESHWSDAENGFRRCVLLKGHEPPCVLVEPKEKP